MLAPCKSRSSPVRLLTPLTTDLFIHKSSFDVSPEVISTPVSAIRISAGSGGDFNPPRIELKAVSIAIESLGQSLSDEGPRHFSLKSPDKISKSTKRYSDVERDALVWAIFLASLGNTFKTVAVTFAGSIESGTVICK